MSSLFAYKTTLFINYSSALPTRSIRPLLLLAGIICYFIHFSLPVLFPSTARIQAPASLEHQSRNNGFSRGSSVNSGTAGNTASKEASGMESKHLPTVKQPQFGTPIHSSSSFSSPSSSSSSRNTRPQPRQARYYHSPIDQLYEDLDVLNSMYDPQDSDLPYVAGADCSGYYCADTQTCVDSPIQCPCPSLLDTKCLRGDWYVCYRGQQPRQC